MSLEENGRDKIPVRELDTLQPGIVNFDELSPDERAAFAAAFAAYKSSRHESVHAGAAAMAENGKLCSTANHIPGSFGHAEQRAISELYQDLPAGHKKLKMLALAVSLAGNSEEEINGGQELVPKDTPLDSFQWSRPCGKCLEFLADCTANVDRNKVEFLGIINSKQAVRLSLGTLMPYPYISSKVTYNPEKQRPEYRTTTGGKSDAQ